MVQLTPDLLLRAYSVGIFPMAETASSRELYWLDPEMRGILPLETFYVPRRLRRTVRRGTLNIRVNADFTGVVEGCAQATPDRPKTWINREIQAAYVELHNRGHAHSVEAWQDGELVGGLYGVAIGGAFFGESMFSRVSDASKIALVHLVARLIAGGYRLLDTQFVTDHLSQFGAIEIPRARYRLLLNHALSTDADFYSSAGPDAVEAILQSTSQIS